MIKPFITSYGLTLENNNKYYLFDNHRISSMASIELGTRKIQVIRGSSYLNLPSIWIKNCHLEKGDAVWIVLLDDGTLKINPRGGDD